MDDDIRMTAEEKSKTAHELMLWELEFLGAYGHPMAREPRWFRRMLRMQKRDRMRVAARKFTKEYGFMTICCAVVVIACAIYGA